MLLKFNKKDFKKSLYLFDDFWIEAEVIANATDYKNPYLFPEIRLERMNEQLAYDRGYSRGIQEAEFRASKYRYQCPSQEEQKILDLIKKVTLSSEEVAKKLGIEF
jgi:hypothetical protein